MVASLEEGLQLLCVTGVEDQLQTDVRPTLELLRNAGIRVGIVSLCGRVCLEEHGFIVLGDGVCISGVCV